MTDIDKAIDMIRSAMRCHVSTPAQAEKKALLPLILKALEESKSKAGA